MYLNVNNKEKFLVDLLRVKKVRERCYEANYNIDSITFLKKISPQGETVLPPPWQWSTISMTKGGRASVKTSQFKIKVHQKIDILID